MLHCSTLSFHIEQHYKQLETYRYLSASFAKLPNIVRSRTLRILWNYVSFNNNSLFYFFNGSLFQKYVFPDMLTEGKAEKELVTLHKD